jgi:uncharacterized protein
MRLRVKLLLTTIGVFGFCSPALAFDCGKAATPVEKTICSDPALKAKDDALGALYADVKAASTPDERKMLAVAQRAWIAEREDACSNPGDTECVAGKTDERIGQFKVVPESGPGAGSRMIPVFVAQTGDAHHYTVAFNMARFASPASPGEKAFNTAIDDVVAKAPLARNEDSSGDRVYESDADLTISYASPRFISAANSYWSDDGGAHGNGGVENINVDLAQGKVIEVADVLTEDGAAKLRAACREQIVAEKKERNDGDYKPEDDSFLTDDVIAEHIATFSRWSFSAKDATISFDSYAVGAYAEGAYDCTFPLDVIRAAAKPGAPLPE